MPDGLSSSRLEDLQMRWQQDPDSRVYLQLAEEYRKLERHPEAIDVLKRGLRSRPNDLSGQVALGRCHLEMEEYDAAAEALEVVVGRDPTHIVGNKLLLEAYLQSGDATRAGERLDLYKLLNQADPDLGDLESRLRGLRQGGPPPAPPRPAVAAPDTPVGAEAAAPSGAERSAAPAAAPAVEADGDPFETWPGRTSLTAEAPAELSPAPAPPPPAPAEPRFEAPAEPRREVPAEPRFEAPPAATPPAVPATPAADSESSLFELEDEPSAEPLAASPEPRYERPPQPPEPSPPEPPPTPSAGVSSSDDDIFDLGPPTAAPNFDGLFDLGPSDQAPSLDDLWGATEPEPAEVETVEEDAAVETIEEDAAIEPVEEPAAAEPIEEVAAVETIEEDAVAELVGEVAVAEPAEEFAEAEEFAVAEPAEELAVAEPVEEALPEPLEEEVAAPEDFAIAEPVEEPALREPSFEAVTSTERIPPEPEDEDIELAEESEEDFEAAEPEPATATLGELYLKQGHVGEAERIFRQVLQQNPRSSAAMAGLARIRGEEGLTAHALLALAGREAPAGLTAKKIRVLESYVQLLRQAAGRIHVP